MPFKRYSTFLLLLLFYTSATLYAQKKDKLRSTLGAMPRKPPLRVDTLEKIKLQHGWRYRVKYLAEDSSSTFHTPKDYIFAFLFIPDVPKNKKLPAIIAIHQDGNHNYLGSMETAGLRGDADQHYGHELFNRGYVVICPDRFLHAERRRINKPDTLADVFEQADIAEQHWLGQLLLSGRNFVGKEVYDLMLTTDVLYTVPSVDKKRIGAIGHSAGGYVLAYFMFADKRISVGASSCGVFELVDWYAEDAIRKRNAMTAIPGLALTGKTSDYVGLIAPRHFLMTRGLYEWGNGNDAQRKDSKKHVEGTAQLEAEARKYYRAVNANTNLKTIYFDEDGGRHSFPLKVKEEVYDWLDTHLKR